MNVTLSSIAILANKKIILVYFCIIPLVNIIVLSLLNNELGSETSSSVATSTVVINGVVLTISTIVGSFVYDSNIGVVRDMVSINPFSMHYWGVKFAVGYVLGIILIFINMIILIFITDQNTSILTALKITPVILLYAVVVGFGCCILSWGQKNPYFLGNVVQGFTYPLGGVIVLYEYYPPLISKFLYLLPFSRTIGLIYSSESYWQYDLLLTIVMSVMFILIYSVKIKHVMSKGRMSLI